MQAIVDHAPKATWYYSDAFDVYASLWYHWGRYAVSEGKTDTYSVDGKCWTQALSGTSGSFLALFFTLSLCFVLRRSIICLLLQPTSIAKTPVPEILFPYHRFRSLTALATPQDFQENMGFGISYAWVL